MWQKMRQRPFLLGASGRAAEDLKIRRELFQHLPTSATWGCRLAGLRGYNKVIEVALSLSNRSHERPAFRADSGAECRVLDVASHKHAATGRPERSTDTKVGVRCVGAFHGGKRRGAHRVAIEPLLLHAN